MASGEPSEPLRDAAAETVAVPDLLPVLALKETVVFPYIIVPLSVARPTSLAAVDRALAGDRMVLLVAQRGSQDEPEPTDLQGTGTAGIIMRMLKLPDGRLRILVQGVARVRVEHVAASDGLLQAKVARLEEPPSPRPTLESEALVRSVKESIEHAAGLGLGLSPEVLVLAANLDEPGRLADLVASNLALRADDAQKVLETLAPLDRLAQASALLAREIQVLTVQEEISSQARGEMDRSQREYYLRQQLKAIQDELGEGEELAAEIAALREAADERGMPEEAREEMERQIRRLERSHPESIETSILRTHLDWLVSLPWRRFSDDDLSLAHARQVLDEDHYDLERVKERILEYLAVRRLNPDVKGPILCFVGPPGVGKTSLGRSIARALGRRFVRLALGGVRDEAEIRGHRRTYVGALPGRILQGMRQAGTGNPVFMLDEIDKIGADFRGDPSAALLEALDPEQNTSFVDHYLGVSYDLSRVLFITTANLLDPIQPAFLDRMEVIRLTGYTEVDKLEIARRHLIPKQVRENGLGNGAIEFTDAGIARVIGDYTREAGLRNLEREIAAICRKVAVEVANRADAEAAAAGDAAADEKAAGADGPVPEGSAPTPPAPTEPEPPASAPAPPLPMSPLEPTVVTAEMVERVLGARRHYSEELLDRDRVGVATGLAWTEAGGDLLFVEVVALPGKGKLLLTGQLGEVMRESAQAALSYARSHAARHGVPAAEFFAEHDIHVHVPAGSIPKDGPSAGITIATAVLSVLLDRAVDRGVAMTGEITLRGDVMPIGGLREKVMAAKIAGVGRMLLPRLNQRDLGEVPEKLRDGIEFHLVDHMDRVLEIALRPAAAGSDREEAAARPGGARSRRRPAGAPSSR
ncbi:MAG TPA: endopeptidase La [Thermoanaerobaculia bacterium]|nr:endopeptidase La [Thermoanaerobaculia bacterium]